MKVTVIGTGYVGLTTGVALAYLGHQVTCIDVDEAKINSLQNGIIPIYEPGLQEIFDLAAKNLHFTSSYPEGLIETDIIFIAVGTPSLSDGSPNMAYVKDAAIKIGQNLGEGFTVIVNKSTVPIGSGNWVEAIIRDAFEARNGHKPQGYFSVSSNPEFLKEGTALSDTLYPDRIVIGSDNRQALDQLTELYSPIIQQDFTPPSFVPRPEKLKSVPLVTTDLASAEMIKYAANAFLSLKISFINEIASISEKVGADIVQIAKGIGLDSRIGPKFLNAGIGWGGSCFGKDTAALVSTAQEYGLKMPIIAASREVNYHLRAKVVEKIMDELKILKGKTIGLLGLAFKPNTDDLRDSPALDIARKLTERGAKVWVHDPIAMERAKKEISDLEIKYASSAEELFDETDAIILVTEWPQYTELPWEQLVSRMRKPFIFDGRNFLDKARLEKAGCKYIGIGK